jgi:hypothetical protein
LTVPSRRSHLIETAALPRASHSRHRNVTSAILIGIMGAMAIMAAHVCCRHPESRLAAAHRKTKNRTLANLSRWPVERIEQLRAVLRGDKLLPAAAAVEIVRALPHGHVLAPRAASRSTRCCRGGRRNAAAIWRWP